MIAPPLRDFSTSLNFNVTEWQKNGPSITSLNIVSEEAHLSYFTVAGVGNDAHPVIKFLSASSWANTYPHGHGQEHTGEILMLQMFSEMSSSSINPPL